MVEHGGATVEWVSGYVGDPLKLATEYRAAYGLASSTWCASSGAAGSPESSTAPEMLSAVFAEDEALGRVAGGAWRVFVSLPGLTPGATYCVALVARSASGTGTSTQVEFTSGAPSATLLFTMELIPDGVTGVTLHASVDADGLQTEYDVVYGSIDSLWCMSSGSMGSPEHSTSPQVLPGEPWWRSYPGEATVSGLSPGAEYCAEFVARNLSTASSELVDFIAGAAWGWGSPQDIGSTTAQVWGVVYSTGLPSEYHVAYGLASSTWCESSGKSGSPEHLTPETSYVSPERLVVSLNGLTPATGYCERLVASDVWGSDVTHQEAFTTLSAAQAPVSQSVGGQVSAPVATPLTHLTISPESFVAANRGSSSAHMVPREHGTGATVRYRLGEAATVTFRVRRLEQGRAVKGGRCVIQTRKNRRARACTLARLLRGSFLIVGKAGSDSFHFTGRFDGKTLSPGRYLLVATAQDSSPVTAGFRIVR